MESLLTSTIVNALKEIGMYAMIYEDGSVHLYCENKGYISDDDYSVYVVGTVMDLIYLARRIYNGEYDDKVKIEVFNKHITVDGINVHTISELIVAIIDIDLFMNLPKDMEIKYSEDPKIFMLRTDKLDEEVIDTIYNEGYKIVWIGTVDGKINITISKEAD